MTELHEISRLSQFKVLNLMLAQRLLRAPSVSTETWQSIDVQSRPESRTRELTHVILDMPIDNYTLNRTYIQPSIPWADDHFEERVSGQPLNPPPSEAWWPYAREGNAEHKRGEVFDHTYPERFWPKWAGDAYSEMAESISLDWNQREGIRYAYGDLTDLVVLMCNQPHTRQAYLPIWFPEDTGAVSGQRVPCTLGYHFLLRSGQMDVTYHIRSCDFLRHFRDDIYLAMRLCQWVSERVPDTKPGKLVMHIGSLHIFEDDVPMLEARVAIEQAEQANEFNRILAGAL